MFIVMLEQKLIQSWCFIQNSRHFRGNLPRSNAFPPRWLRIPVPILEHCPPLETSGKPAGDQGGGESWKYRLGPGLQELRTSKFLGKKSLLFSSQLAARVDDHQNQGEHEEQVQAIKVL